VEEEEEEDGSEGIGYPAHSMKAYRGRRGLAILILSLGTRCRLDILENRNFFLSLPSFEHRTAKLSLYRVFFPCYNALQGFKCRWMQGFGVRINERVCVSYPEDGCFYLTADQ
jgi:hypothetical protein